MVAKIYSDKQIINFHNEYLKNNISIVSFAKKKNISQSALRSGFKRLKLKIIPQSITRQKYLINESFFENIDTEEKAYVLGFMYADGCNDDKYRRISISLAKQDEDILIKISKLLLNGNISINEYSCKNKGTNYQNRIMLNIISQKMCDDLSKVGCVPRKTFVLKFPNLSKHLQPHFIRGYFDGDGMLAIYSRMKSRCINKTTTAEFSIVSTKEMLNEIGKHISNLSVNFKINKRHQNRKNNNYTLRVFGNQQIKIVCDYFYKDAAIYLDRKYNKYLELLELSKNFRKKYNYE